MSAQREKTIALVGAGPRALSLIERLAARLGAFPPVGPLRVVAIDDAAPGAGANWSPELPPELIMNTLAEETTIFPSPDLAPRPVLPARSLAQWLDAVQFGNASSADPAVLAAASARSPYPPRRVLGAYLRWHFDEFARRFPAPHRLESLPGRIVALRECAHGQVIEFESGAELRADVVVLATGHTGNRLGFEPLGGEVDHRAPGSIEQHLSGGPGPSETVLVRGFGLHFHDLVARWTQGRGGRFESANGRVHYLPSGAEPIVAVTSRRGLPYRARPNSPVAYDIGPLAEELAAAAGRPELTFSRDVLPIVLRHVAREAALIGADVSTVRDLRRLSDPLDGFEPGSLEDLTRRVLDELDRDVAAAERPTASSRQRAAAVLRSAAAPIGRLREFRGFDDDGGPVSYQEFGGWFSFLGAGPPVERIAQLAALIRAGVVVPLGRSAVIEAEGGQAVVRSGPGRSLRSSRLIEARSPSRLAMHSASRLLGGLLRSGDARLFRTVAGFQPGSLDITREHRIVRADGSAHPTLFALGLPVLGTEHSTAVEVTRGSDAVHCATQDLVAREIIESFAHVREVEVGAGWTSA